MRKKTTDSPRRGAVRAAGALLVLLALGGIQPPQAAAAPLATDPVLEAFDELEAYIASLPLNPLNRGQMNSLQHKVQNAEQAYRRGQPCTAANILRAYLNETQALRKGPRVGVAEDLHNRGHGLRGMVVAAAGPGSPCADHALGRAPEVAIQTSDNARFAARIAFGAPELGTVHAGGETWTQLGLPAVQSLIGPPGLPALPSWQALLAVPQGATPVVGAVRPHVREIVRLNLIPFQDQAADQGRTELPPDVPPPPEAFADPPFVKDAAAYARDALAPPNPCAVRLLGQYRDLAIAQIQCMVGQYNPVTDELRLFDAVEVQVDFQGGRGTFITTQTMSPFEKGSRALVHKVLNAEAVRRFVEPLDLSFLPCFGEELLVLTHPDFRPAADTLAQWKRDKGIATTVIEVGAGTAHPTAAAIDDLIEGRYDACMVRPSYVLLLGDAEFVPPARTDYDTSTACGGCGDTTTGSDYGYATYVQALFDVFFPDFAVGRIPVDTLAQATTVVDKIVGYESSPPFINLGAGGPFYTTAAFASYFQCCRTSVAQAGRDMRSFIETAELLRDHLLGRGYAVQRIYDTDTGYATDPVADPTPRRYYNGTPLPADLGPGSGFAWDGSTQDIIDAWNEGRFLVLHRDHGSSNGFGSPGFSTANVTNNLANGALLPVVYSVNCSSGFFDNETNVGSNAAGVYFVEQLLREPGAGAVGVLGDVRNSPTWANSALTRGFFDATWPDVAPEFGGAVARRRLGDILNHGRVYLLSQIGVAQTAGEVSLNAALGELIMWHAYGDPTLEMWTRNPYRLTLPGEFTAELLPELLRVRYAVEGAEITALQETPNGGLRAIGRGMVRNGAAELMLLFGQPDPGAPILLSASLEDAISLLLTPRSSPAPDVR